MKNLSYIPVLFIATIFFSCKKVDKLTQFEMEYNETFVIPSTVGIDLPFNVMSPDITTNSQSTFEVNDTKKDLIEQIMLTQLDLTLTGPSNSDFSFLNEVRIYISAEGLDEVELASKTDIPDNIGKELSLDPSGADFQEYIKQDQFDLRLYTVTDQIITSDHTLDMKSVFFVDAKVLGQ